MRSSNNVQNNKPEAALQKNIFKPRAVYAQRLIKGLRASAKSRLNAGLGFLIGDNDG
jgi:hypothetical protein